MPCCICCTRASSTNFSTIAAGSAAPTSRSQRLFHQGMVLYNGEKMSKSRGNVIGIDETAETNGVDAMRLFLALRHAARRYERLDRRRHQRPRAFRQPRVARVRAAARARDGGVAARTAQRANARRKGAACAPFTSPRNRRSTKRVAPLPFQYDDRASSTNTSTR